MVSSSKKPAHDVFFTDRYIAVRVEQSVGGGENIPSCAKSSGEQVTDGIEAQAATTLCSCLYKNFTPEGPS